MQVEFPKLEAIRLSFLNVEKIWIDNQLITRSRFDFQSLTELYVSNCDHLNGLIPSSMTASTGLVHLRSLIVCRCKAMKEIVFTNFAEEESFVNRVPFPELETLQLEQLPNLERFCDGDYCVECPYLSKLEISYCKKLQLFKKKISLPTTTNQLQNENLAGSVEYTQHSSHHKVNLQKKIVFTSYLFVLAKLIRKRKKKN